MHRMVLDIDDSVLGKISYFLNNLPKRDVTVISDIVIDEPISINTKIKTILAGETFYKDIEDPVKWQREQRDEWE